MNNITDRWAWRAFGATVRGAAHGRRDKGNQDAIQWMPQEGAGRRAIVAVADGHGGARYFRSHLGARYAAEVSVEALDELLGEEGKEADLSFIKRTAEDMLPGAILRRWEQRVDRNLRENPLDGVSRSDGDGRRAYGTTLVTAAVGQGFMLFVQLGDGDILVVTADGNVRRPLPPDERLLGNETTSLCSPQAWKEFRVQMTAIYESPPALILAATDGYVNSFQSQASFEQAGVDFYGMLRQPDGAERIRAHLEGWLRETTALGSGDDITVGLLFPGPRDLSSAGNPQDAETTSEGERLQTLALMIRPQNEDADER